MDFGIHNEPTKRKFVKAQKIVLGEMDDYFLQAPLTREKYFIMTVRLFIQIQE